MKTSLVLLLLLLVVTSSLGEIVSNKPRSCSKFQFNTLWSSSLRNSPLMTIPLLIDVDGDSLRDIIAPSYSGEVYAIHGENGHIVDNWPFYIEDRAFYASPIAYDVDDNGVLDIVLSTTDAEIIFLKTDNTLFHGETIKIPPVRVRKDWYKLDKQYIDNLASEMIKQIGDRFVTEKTTILSNKESDQPTEVVFSDIDNQLGNKADPLYSHYYPNDRVSGIDPTDSDYVYIDPHVLATPVLCDMNNDGYKNELVVPVSYYFDSFEYGNHARLLKTHLSADELQLYAVEGVAIIDLKTKEILKHKILSLTKIDSNQPAFLLSSPTVVKLSPDSPVQVIIGTVSGKLHVLEGIDLTDRLGFPLTMDSISAQVAVEDIVGNDNNLEMVIGDNSGNIICVDINGNRIWEHEAKVAIESSVRFADLYSDNKMEVIFVTKYGDLWVLDGTNGLPLDGYPMALNTMVHSSVYLMHLSPKSSSSDYHLSVIIPAISGMYVVDLYGGCVDHITIATDIIPHTIQSDHIDPFNPGIEILTTSLSGELLLFSTSTIQPSDFEVSIDSWPSDTSSSSSNGFTHKQSSFALVCGRGLTPRDATGTSFKMSFNIYDNRTSEIRPHTYFISVTIGNKFKLLTDTIIVTQNMTAITRDILTPPIPTRSTVIVEICNIHQQCDMATYTVRFNQSFEDTFGWCLALPFFALVASYLWLLRNENTISLPTVIKSSKWT